MGSGCDLAAERAATLARHYGVVRRLLPPALRRLVPRELRWPRRRRRRAVLEVLCQAHRLGFPSPNAKRIAAWITPPPDDGSIGRHAYRIHRRTSAVWRDLLRLERRGLVQSWRTVDDPTITASDAPDLWASEPEWRLTPQGHLACGHRCRVRAGREAPHSKDARARGAEVG